MSRFFAVSVFLVALGACRLPPDRTPLNPLPEDGQVFTYEEILSRARAQAATALEAFFVDNWGELADAARGLEQTARFLPKAVEPPANLAGKLVKESVILHKDALRLIDAANARDVNAANETLQRIHLKVRQLRPEPAQKQAEPPRDKTK
jgi:hypothetical protein